MAFNIPNQTTVALQRPTNPSTTWTRPASWPTITDDPNKVQFLYADTWPTCSISTDFLRTTASANLYIDWGDGTSPTTSSTADITTYYSHNYTPGTGVTSSLGYSTFVISVFTDESASVIQAVPVPRAFTNPTGYLEAYYGDNTLTASGISGNTLANAFKSGTNFNQNYMLEYVKLPATYTGTTFDGTFFGCFNLAKVDMPTSLPNVTNLKDTFRDCITLSSVTLPAMPSNTSFESTFRACSTLNSVSLANSYPLVIRTDNMFNGASSLSNIIVPSLPSCTNYRSAFSGCRSLLEINIPTFATAPGGLDVGNTFQNCSSLANIVLPNTASVTFVFQFGSTFAGCTALPQITLPEYWNARTMASLFSGCTNLQSVVLPVSMSELNTMASAFNGCTNLQNITLPQVVSSSISLDTAFTNCLALSKVDIPQSYNITSLLATFQNDANLTSVILPTGSQNSLTTMNSTFNGCSALESVTLPSSMTALTSLVTTFQSCFNLTSSIIFPSSLNSVTAANNLFQNCYSLTSVTLPISMSACSNFVNAFQNCSLLGVSGSSVITMPSIVSTATNYNAAFQGCSSIQNIVLPTTQTTAVGFNFTMTATFQNCFNLKSITNVDKIGNPSPTGTLLAATDFASNNYNNTSSLSFSSRLNKLGVNGTNTTTQFSKIPEVRLTNTGSGQWTNVTPQINVSYTNMSTAALNTLFADMAAQGSVTSKTINITGAAGAAGLTAGDRLVITSIGWTITG
jgi:hypothetical protein